MKKLFYFSLIVFMIYSCSDDSEYIDNEITSESANRGPQPSTDCGTLVCDFEDISLSDYSSLCDYNEALVAQFNSCTIVTANENCISTLSTLNDFTKTPRGFDANLYINLDLLDEFLSTQSTVGSIGPLCSYEEDYNGYCWFDALSSEVSSNCGGSSGWTVTSESLEAYAQFAYNAACSLSGTSCNPGYELNLTGLDFYLGSLTCGDNCDWELCAETGLYYPTGGCGDQLIFTASYSCCAID